MDPRIVTPRQRSRLAVPLTVAAIVLALVATVGFVITAHPAWSVAEGQAIRAVQHAGGASLQIAGGAIAVAFGPAGAILVVLVVLSVAYLGTRSWRLTARTAVVLAVPWAVAESLKEVVKRPRPDPALLGLTPEPLTYSFPSGHTAFAAALGCAVAIVLVTGRLRIVAIAVAAAVALVTAWSRVYVGAHYPSDVIASLILVPVVAVAVNRLAVRIPFLR
jgi:undecaprenyl-diphosphatase